MKFLIVFLTFLIICTASESEKESGPDNAVEDETEETTEDIIRKFEERVKVTADAITDNTKDVIELAKDPVEKSVAKAEADTMTLLKDGEEIVTKFNKIKAKVQRDLKECKDKFLGESSVLGHFIVSAKELETLAKEIQKCPTDSISGMGCTLGKLMRGEGLMEEVEDLMKAEKDTPKQRADTIIERVETCNAKVIAAATIATKEFLEEMKKCIKDEL